jgi:hypothetical protein
MSRLAGGKTPASVLQYLGGVSFPAKKDDIVHAARKNGAPNDVVGALSQLPQTDFNSQEELINAYPQMPG